MIKKIFLFSRIISDFKKVKNNKIKLILIKDIGTPIRLFVENEKLLSNFLKNELVGSLHSITYKLMTVSESKKNEF